MSFYAYLKKPTKPNQGNMKTLKALVEFHTSCCFKRQILKSSPTPCYRFLWLTW